MRLDAKAFATAAAIVSATVSALCALYVAVAPGSATALASAVVHLDLTSLARPVSLGNFIGGVLFWAVGSALIFGLAAAIYNVLAARRGVGAGPA